MTATRLAEPTATDWQPRRYRVSTRDQLGIRCTIEVAAAIGPNDAKNQVRAEYPHLEPLKATPA